MKKYFLLISLLFVIVSCNNNAIEKPKNYIEKDKMINMLYDLAVLEAMKSQNVTSNTYPTSTELLKNKYQIDSITFANNAKYYASDVNEYKKMYQEVKERLAQEIDKNNGNKQEAPTITN